MNKWTEKLRQGLAGFMAGRYGADQLNFAIILLALAVTIAGSLSGLRLLVIAADALIVLAFFRMLSRNRDARAAENRAWFTKTYGARKAAFEWLNRTKNRKQYRYYTCPKCRERLRVPRGVGHVTVTCRKCGEQFEKKA